MSEDGKQYWLMVEDHSCGMTDEFDDEIESSNMMHYWGTPFDSLAKLIVYVSNNHIALNKTKIVIGKESRLKLELV